VAETSAAFGHFIAQRGSRARPENGGALAVARHLPESGGSAGLRSLVALPLAVSVFSIGSSGNPGSWPAGNQPRIAALVGGLPDSKGAAGRHSTSVSTPASFAMPPTPLTGPLYAQPISRSPSQEKTGRHAAPLLMEGGDRTTP